MKKIKEAFDKISKMEKIALIVGFISALMIFFFAFLQLTGIWESAINVMEVFMGIMMVSQAVTQWKRNKGVAIFSLLVAIFVFTVAFFVFFLR